MITKDEFIAQAERNAANLADLPVTSALLRHLVEELKKGDPRWWKQTFVAWKERRFVQWTESSNLFITCLHYEALEDEKNPLVPFFPSCGGSADDDPTEALSDFLEDPPERFFANLKKGQRRFYGAIPGGLWRRAAALSFQQRQMPYYLVEINAGAGLNLVADALLYVQEFESELVEARIGFDSAPLRAEDPAQVSWLAASVLPDHAAAIKSLHGAVTSLQEILQKDAEALQLFQCETALAPQTIAKNVPANDPQVGLLVFNYMATSRLADADYEAFKAQMLGLLKPWGDRGLWFEVENVRGEAFATALQYRLHRVMGAKLTTHEMGRADFAAKKDLYDYKGTLEFLSSVAKPASSK